MQSVDRGTGADLDTKSKTCVEWQVVTGRLCCDGQRRCTGHLHGQYHSITGRMGRWREETTRFADFELAETDDATVFFDARPVNGLPYASPIQAYVECKTGDKREKETADQVARVILDGLSIKGL